MKKIFFITIFCLAASIQLKANEPFVVLEYKGQMSKNASNNKFLKDQNYSLMHQVKPGESLSEILQKYYGKSGLNMKIIEISVIQINRHAFVRNNPHYLYAGKKIKIPSLNEIMNLVKNNPKKSVEKSVNNRSHIYFYGN